MATAHINTDMLIWARMRSRIGVPELSHKLGVTESRLEKWRNKQKPHKKIKLGFNLAEQKLVYSECQIQAPLIHHFL